MRGVVVIALGAGFAGCAEPAAPIDPKVFLTRPQNQYQVNGTGFQMNFPWEEGGNGVQMPNVLLLGGDSTNALGNASCPAESLVGIGLYPAAIVASDTDDSPSNTGTNPSITTVHEGPAVMSLAVSYTVPYTCGMQRNITGTSTFTFFPSSRIVRHDVVNASPDVITGYGSCMTCAGNPGGWYFTSFWTFATTSVLNRSGDRLTSFDNAPESCVQIGQNSIAIDWLGSGMTRAMYPSPTTGATVYDFQRNGNDLTVRDGDVTSALQIGFADQGTAAQQCNSLLGALTTAPIRVNGARVPMNADGIYVDETVHRGTIEITAQDGDVAPFAVILDLGSARHARVTGRTYGQYVIQEVTSTSNPNDFLFWFDDGIANFAEPFSIEPY